MSDERFSRLPKWAQEEMTNIYRKLNEAADEIALLRGDVKTNAYIWHMEGKSQPIDDHATVVFILADGSRVDVGMPFDRSYLRVQAGRMVVRPQASNVIQITGDRT